MRRSDLDSNTGNPSPTLSYASMFISSTPQSVRGSPVLRSRSNSLPNNYLNNLQVSVPFGKAKSLKKQSNGKTRKNEKTPTGKRNRFTTNKQKSKKCADEMNTSNHISNDSLSMRGLGTSQCSKKKHSTTSRQGERERQRVVKLQDGFGSFVARGSESIVFRDLNAKRATPL